MFTESLQMTVVRMQSLLLRPVRRLVSPAAGARRLPAPRSPASEVLRRVDGTEVVCGRLHHARSTPQARTLSGRGSDALGGRLLEQLLELRLGDGQGLRSAAALAGLEDGDVEDDRRLLLASVGLRRETDVVGGLRLGVHGLRGLRL